MLAFFLFIALTNLTLGIVLGYFYGPLFVPRPVEDAAVAPQNDQTTPPAASLPVVNAAQPIAAPAPTAVPRAKEPAASPAEDLRPIRPTGSREISALDLADVMSELGVAPAATPPARTMPAAEAANPVAAPPAESETAAPTAPAITIEALTGEPAPLAG